MSTPKHTYTAEEADAILAGLCARPIKVILSPDITPEGVAAARKKFDELQAAKAAARRARLDIEKTPY
jgi:hypothetical protein